MKKLLLITCLISLVCVGSLFAEEHMITDKAELQKVSFELKPVVKGSTENMVLFGGRLAEYRYYDMDDTIESAMKLFNRDNNSL